MLIKIKYTHYSGYRLLGSQILFDIYTLVVQFLFILIWCVTFETLKNIIEFYLYIYKYTNLLQIKVLDLNIKTNKYCHLKKFLNHLATPYTQSRLVTLPPQRLTAAAGTLLAWDSP